MRKPILYRLFRVGSIPREIMPILEKEEIVVVDQGMRGRYITKRLKAPGKRALLREEGFIGSLAVTKKRLLCYTYKKRQINIDVRDPKMTHFYVNIPRKNEFALSFESSSFQEDRQGVIEFLYRTEKANKFYEVFICLGAKHGSPRIKS